MVIRNEIHIQSFTARNSVSIHANASPPVEVATRANETFGGKLTLNSSAPASVTTVKHLARQAGPASRWISGAQLRIAY
jgi:hypothetical protein